MQEDPNVLPPDTAWNNTINYILGKSQTLPTAVAQGQAQTEAVRVDFALEPGCNCPNGTQCGANGECLDPCIHSGELKYVCKNPGEVCVNQWCVKDPCETMICNAGFVCHEGVCTEIACSNVCCGDGEVCSAGQCVKNSCGAGCPAGQACVAGNCVDGCTTLTCVNGLGCSDGSCIPECELDPSKCGGGSDGGMAWDGLFPDQGSPPNDAATEAAGHSYTPAGGAATGDEGGCGCRAAAGKGPAASLAWLAFACLAAVRKRTLRRRHS
jgi:hypothetical protein